ncbi:MAG: efflux transporter outer membrane subunit [Desulfobacterales bacterium]|nr:efflux transporter outer membrane subunit [Desulfobacterales bacterium]
MSSSKSILVLLLGLFLFSGGCVRSGPGRARPDPGFETPGAWRQAPDAAGPADEDPRWHRVFGDPELDRIVEEVLKNNLDIRKATARVLEARARFMGAGADRLPELKLGLAVDRRRVSGITGDSVEFSFPASFELDLWGRLARLEDAARFELLRREENRRTAAQTVVARAVTLYLQMEALERRIQIARRSVSSFGRSKNFVETRYKRGLTSVLDVRQARRILAQARARIPELRQELGINQQQLALLLGRYPETSPPRPQPEDYYRRLSPVPPGIPSDLLRRRPDIRAAEAYLHELSALVDAAEAARFPTISLTGGFGFASDELNTLIHPNSVLWSLSAGLVQPLFDAGKRKEAQNEAEAGYQVAAAEYAKTVLNAFAEVEAALLIREMQLERRERVLEYLREARVAQEVAQKRYQRGLVDYLIVLDAQQNRFQAEDSLALVDLAIMSNRVSLHRALGGGWGDPGPGDR